MPFGCISCGRPADQLVQRASYALHDPSALAVNNVLVAVCDASSCHVQANVVLDKSESMKASKFGLPSVGPEMLMCANCHELAETPHPRCGRCQGPPYCSVACQKAHWRSHKRRCSGRIEAAKLSPLELETIDDHANEITHGTRELTKLNHAGAFPARQEMLGLGTDLRGFGVDKAKERQRAMRKAAPKLNAKYAKEAQSSSTESFVPPQEAKELPSCFSVFEYFDDT